MNRKLRPARSTQQIKKEQIKFFLENVEKILEENKKAIELKDKQLSDVKKKYYRVLKKATTLL